MPILLGFYPSPRKGKRYRMILADPHQVLDFGFKDGSTFIDHGVQPLSTTGMKSKERIICLVILNEKSGLK